MTDGIRATTNSIRRVVPHHEKTRDRTVALFDHSRAKLLEAQTLSDSLETSNHLHVKSLCRVNPNHVTHKLPDKLKTRFGRKMLISLQNDVRQEMVTLEETYVQEVCLIILSK